MATRPRGGSLTREEKRVVKALLSKGWRNQDIQALINIERPATINGARITGVKTDARQQSASDEEVAFFERKKRSYDWQTGLNPLENERLIRAREAMILAVQIFNSAALSFKTEVFSVLANIAWTYLLHEYYDRKGVSIVGRDGRSIALSQMTARPDCPLSQGIRNNLSALKLIRDDVEHKLLGKSDAKWQGLFQATCLNFEKTLCELFGNRLSLSRELSFALQFAKMNIEQLAALTKFDIPEHINALDARIQESFTEEQMADLEYQFRVIYTLDVASKGRAHFEFLGADEALGKEIRNIAVKYKAADHLYPHKPQVVCGMVREATGKAFTNHNHIQAWRLHRVRPLGSSRNPENTNKDYCIYHAAHADYTYSDSWVSLLIEDVQDDTRFAAIKAIRVG